MLSALRQQALTLLCAAALLGALWIALSEYRALRLQADDNPIERLQALERAQPWGGLAARDLAGRLDARWRLNPAEAQQVLVWALHRYPLDPWRWLLLARIDQEINPDPMLSRQRLDAALAVQPQQRELRWRALNLAQNFGDADLIADQLQFWLQGQPGQVHNGLFLARRWFSDPDERLDRALPPGRDYLVRAMRHARVSAQPDLARAVWQRLAPPHQPGDPAVADYIAALQAAGDTAAVEALWEQLDPAYQPGQVPGGHFAFDLDSLASFGWDLRMPRGVTLVRTDSGLPPPAAGALRLEFDGTENVHLFRPMARFPAPAPGAYRLHGWWQARQLTTRTLPSLHVRELDGPFRGRLELPSADFDWQPFTLDIELTAPGDRLQLQIQRRRTDAFDRNIGGRLEIAGLHLEPVEAAP